MIKAPISIEQLRQINDNLVEITNQITVITDACRNLIHGIKSINAILDNVADGMRKGNE
jgi:hypothetical protein